MIRKAGPQEEIGYVSQTTEVEESKEQTVEQAKEPAPEIGYVSQNLPILEKLETITEKGRPITMDHGAPSPAIK